MTIINYCSYPTQKEYDTICEPKNHIFNELQLELYSKTTNLMDIEFFELSNIELNELLQAYNDRVFNLKTNYVMAMHYFNKGIPDEEWCAKGQPIKYFPNFTDESYGYHYWFIFYTDSFFSRVFGIIDAAYHFIDGKYFLETPKQLGFNRKVSDKLIEINPDLKTKMDKLYKSAVYKKLVTIRNDITHNIKPSEIKDTVVRKGCMIDFGAGKYTTTKEFVSYFDDAFNLLLELSSILKEIL